MHGFHYFFFSYAGANHANAQRGRQNPQVNRLDQFYDDLCREVSDRTGMPPDQVGYRDRNRLRIGDFWDRELVNGLQRSRVLLPLFSPHYLQSANCGRELAFFEQRLKKYNDVSGISSTTSHRILPVFWLDSQSCLKNAPSRAAALIMGCNYTQMGMPQTYPAVGLSQICKLGNEVEYEQLCQCLAGRIVELADLDPLPELLEGESFLKIKSLYESEENNFITGPSSVNVIYLVCTASEISALEKSHNDIYSDRRESWCPFASAPGATIEILTKEGANLVHLQINNIAAVDNLDTFVSKAEEHNSIVLFVLDRCALLHPNMASKISRLINQEGFAHCGLVTAGGHEISDDFVESIFKYKYSSSLPYHSWRLPLTRDEYVSSVKYVLSGIIGKLASRGRIDVPLSSSLAPKLNVPSGK